MNRNEFREAVFKRDNHKCLFCNNKAKDAHHIIERKLWDDGGYYLDNGASLCETHHLEAEMTLISVEQIREKIGCKPIVPSHLYDDEVYTKWGDVVLPNGLRTKGELFYDPNVQKILAQGNVLHLYTDYVKYPRTYHLPWSLSVGKDDRILNNLDNFKNKEVIVLEKLDGENTTMYNNYIHARSVNSRNHASQNWVKNFWGSIKHDIPKGWRICGENMYAKHSIYYDNLETYFYGFSMWNEKNVCLNWESTLEWFKLLNIKHPKIFYKGVFDEKKIQSVYNNSMAELVEGYVVRVAEEFSYGSFKNCVAKMVRANHVRTTKHWMFGQPITPNKIGVRQTGKK